MGSWVMNEDRFRTEGQETHILAQSQALSISTGWIKVTGFTSFLCELNNCEEDFWSPIKLQHSAIPSDFPG